MRHKGSHSTCSHLARQRRINVGKIAYRKASVEIDTLHRFIPGEHTIGKVLGLCTHPQFPYNRATAFRLRTNPERQSTGTFLTIIHLFLKTFFRPSGRIGDLPCMKFSIRLKFNTTTANASQCNTAITDLSHRKFRHNTPAHLRIFCNTARHCIVKSKSAVLQLYTHYITLKFIIQARFICFSLLLSNCSSHTNLPLTFPAQTTILIKY